MKTPTLTARMLIRILAPIQIVLGLALWTGGADRVVPIHMLIGIAIVLGLWTLALVGARAGVAPGFVAVAFLWGLLTIILGVVQEGLFEGNLHWVVQVIHLVIGLGAIGLAEQLGRRILGLIGTEAIA